MAYLINEQCISCDACRPECPTASIFPVIPHYEIDADTCDDCKLCVAVCPVSAIVENTLYRKLSAKPEVERGEL